MPRRSLPNSAAWSAAAVAVAAAWGESWESAPAVRAIEALPEEAVLGVAFSGGADSLAALLSVWARWPARRTRLVAVHFNHRLRGAVADRDEAFCRKVCAALGVQLRVGRARWSRPAAAIGETEARTARWRFFDRALRAVGAGFVVLGHQRDDVAETLLMRLARGVGSRGLAAPRPVQAMAAGATRLRPLLELSHDRIVAVLAAHGLPWCEDATNRSGRFLRNRIRREVVPRWRRAVEPRRLAEAVARSRMLLEEEDAALESWVDSIVPRAGRDATGEWSVAGWTELPAAVVRRALFRWLLRHGMADALAPAEADRFVAAIRGGAEVRASVGRRTFVELAAGRLRLSTLARDASQRGRGYRRTGQTLVVPGEWRGVGGDRLVAEFVPRARREATIADIRAAGPGSRVLLGFDGSSAPKLLVRSWRPGDRWLPFGAKQATKLQDQFVNRRIPRALRSVLPVITDGADTILWVPGLPPAETTRATSGSRVLVQLTYQTALPRSPSHSCPKTNHPNADR